MAKDKRDDVDAPISCPDVGRIETPAHYHGAIGEALGRVKAAPGTEQEQRLSALVEAIEEYEQREGHDIAEEDKLSVKIRKVRVNVGIEEKKPTDEEEP
jgi:hypothetical protein